MSCGRGLGPQCVAAVLLRGFEGKTLCINTLSLCGFVLCDMLPRYVHQLGKHTVSCLMCACLLCRHHFQPISGPQVDEAPVWSELGHAYLAAGQVPDAIAAYLRSNDTSKYAEVIDACKGE